MASALPGDIFIGEHSVCLMRAALLDADCTPVGGADSGIITTGIITATATPEFIDGALFETQNGCGNVEWSYETKRKIRRYTLSGELTYFDHEAMYVLFGGDLIVGDTGTGFEGDNIGWAAPWYTGGRPPDVYLEFITLAAPVGVGDCVDGSGDALPYAVGHIFPKVGLVPGERTMAFEAATLSFEGSSMNNPNIGYGPWHDFPGVDGIANSGYSTIAYSADEYAAIADMAACGFRYTPTYLLDDEGGVLLDGEDGIPLIG